MISEKPGICLVGLGPHAKRIYSKYIEHDVLSKKLNFYLLIDLYSQKNNIDNYYTDKKVRPSNIFLSRMKNQITPKRIDKNLKILLDTAIKEKKISYAIVSTEPKAHKIYIEYFLKHKIPVLTDKPITAPIGTNYNLKAAKKIFKDAQYLNNLSKKYKTPLYIQAQRREHSAYKFIFKEIRKVISDYQVPITFFNIYHSDGQWSMPQEFSNRENHPHKYGYGKIMHSGYHFADIVSWIIESNQILHKNLKVTNNTKVLKPGDNYDQLNGKLLYRKLFNKITLKPENNGMGEVDSYTTFVIKKNNFNSKSNILTYGNLNMLQSGFSKRSWYELPEDTYKGNGRLRHEYLNINVGPLLNIQLHSYQSEKKGNKKITKTGYQNHLIVYIFRNSKIIGGKPFEVIDFGDKIKKNENKISFYLGHNEFARYIVYKKMINKKTDSSTLIQAQQLTNKLISNMYISVIKNKDITFEIK